MKQFDITQLETPKKMLQQDLVTCTDVLRNDIKLQGKIRAVNCGFLAIGLLCLLGCAFFSVIFAMTGQWPLPEGEERTCLFFLYGLGAGIVVLSFFFILFRVDPHTVAVQRALKELMDFRKEWDKATVKDPKTLTQWRDEADKLMEECLNLF